MPCYRDPPSTSSRAGHGRTRRPYPYCAPWPAPCAWPCSPSARPSACLRGWHLWRQACCAARRHRVWICLSCNSSNRCAIFRPERACTPRKGRLIPRNGCCGSSVAEHTLGKGEVESSILSHSTISLFAPENSPKYLKGNENFGVSYTPF